MTDEELLQAELEKYEEKPHLDAKRRVLARYPDAVCLACFTAKEVRRGCRKRDAFSICTTIEFIGRSLISEQDAWIDAASRLGRVATSKAGKRFSSL
jgi:hypothetical protein